MMANLNKFVKIRDDLDKATNKKIKQLLKKLKKSQDLTVQQVAAIILNNMDNDGFFALSGNQLDELKEAITKNLSDASVEEQEFIQGLLEDAYIETTEKTYTSLGIKKDFSLVRPEMVAQAVNTPIDGKRFSERIWANNEKLANRIYADVLDCIKNGTRPNAIARQIKKDFGCTAYEAKRLVNTELAKVVNAAQMEIYQSEGIEQVLWTATLENNTCDYCADMDGRLFDVKNAPNLPAHPCCRCCLVPVVDGWKPQYRADNETKQKIEYKNYKDWSNS